MATYHRAHGDQKDGTRRHRVDDLTAAIEFFVQLGLEPRGKGQVEGPWVERIIALDEVRVELAMLRTADGHGEIELVKARGTELVGELVRYEDSYRLCYVRGPAGIIVELAEKIGGRTPSAADRPPTERDQD